MSTDPTQGWPGAALPAGILAVVALALIAGMAVTVAVGLVSGRINTHGLLRDKAGGGISGVRIQLLIATLAGALFYLAQTLRNVGAGTFPPVPTELLLLAGGSNVVYLVGKLQPLLRKIS